MAFGRTAVGSGFVQVVPSFSGFHQRARRDLAKIDLSGVIRMAPEVDTGVAKGEATAAAKAMGREVTFTPEMDTGAGQAKATAAARAMGRTVHFQIDVDGAGVAGAGAALGGLAGNATRASDAGGMAGRSLMMVGAVAAAAAPAVGLIATALAALPAAAAAGGAALGAIALGAQGIGDAAKTIQPQFDALKQSISATFQQELTPVFARIGTVLLPGITAGMQGVATSLSGLFAAFTDVVTSAQGMDVINTILARTAGFLAALEPVITTGTRAFLTLADVGTQALAPLAATLNGFAVAFSDMANRVTASGALAQAFSGLDQVLSSVLGLFVQVMEAGINAMATLGGPLAALISGLGDVFVALMPALTALSGTVATVLSGLAAAVVPVVSALTPVFAELATIVGGVLTQALAMLGPPLAHLAGTLAAALAPVLPVIAHALRSVVDAAAPVIPVLTQGLGQAVTMLAPVLGHVAGVLGGALVAALGAVVPLVGPLVGLFNAVLAAVLPLVPALLQLALQPLTLLADLIPVLMPVVTALVDALSQILPPVVAVATALISALMPVLQALTPVVTALAGVLADVLGWALGTVIVPLLSRVVIPAIQLLARVFTWLANTVVVPAMTFITNAITAAWSVVSPVWTALSTALRAVGDWFVWLWRTAIAPAWNAITAAITAAWSTVIAPVLAAIGTALATLGAVIGTVLVAPFVIAWNAVSAAARLAWDTVLRPVFDAIGATARFLWETVLRPVFNAIGAGWQMLLDGINWVWLNILRPVFDAIGAAVHGVGQAFANVVEWVRNTWSQIADIAKKPVNFVVDVVYNRGIVPVWNGIAGVFGLGKLEPMALLASGGTVPAAPMVTNRPTAIVGEGNPAYPEYVIPTDPRYRRRAGALWTDAGANLGMPMMASGGVLGGAWDAVGGIAGSVIGGIGDAFSWVMSIAGDIAGGVRELFGAILGDADRTPGGGTWTDALKRLPVTVIDNAIKAVTDWFGSMGGAGAYGAVPVAGGAGVQRWAPLVLQALAMLGQPAAYLGITLRRMNQESGGDPNIGNYWDINAQRGTPSLGLMQVIGPTFAAYRDPRAPANILDPLANILASMRYALARYGSLPAAYNRPGGYDSGGWLPPGYSLTYNGTGRPEAVLTGDQWDTMRSAAEGRGTSITVNYAESDVDPQRVAAAIDRRLAMTGRL